MKVVPLQRLAIGVKTLHHLLLNRKCAGPILSAVEHQRRALDFAGGVVGMARADFRRLLVAHRRIVRDKGAHYWRGGDKVNTDAPTHAVSDHPNPRAVDLVARK